MCLQQGSAKVGKRTLFKARLVSKHCEALLGKKLAQIRLFRDERREMLTATNCTTIGAQHVGLATIIHMQRLQQEETLRSAFVWEVKLIKLSLIFIMVVFYTLLLLLLHYGDFDWSTTSYSTSMEELERDYTL